jgi:hypothetical protein
MHRSDDFPARPLTLPELEALHAPDEWHARRIPGLPGPKPWRVIALSALVGGGLGFVLALGWHLTHLPLAPSTPHAPSARAPHQPLPSMPRLDDARAVPERQTASVGLRAPEPEVPPVIADDTPRGFVAAEVDPETARRFEREHARRRAVD